MSFYQLDFEREIVELENRIKAAERAAKSGAADGVPALGGVDPAAGSAPEDPASLRSQRDARLGEIYKSLTSWDIVRVARHPERPQSRDYIRLMCRDFAELHGDRRFGDDPAIVTGFARLGRHKVLVVGHQKGKDTQEKLACHFGCAHPEGYRKALAKMQLAEKFGVPIVTLVDTPGAYPGLGAEERGQAEAIAVNLREMSRLRVPIVSVVIGEGGSGGALGIAVADRVGMLEFAWYSVISPEGCAAILWKEANDKTTRAAAEALRLTARHNLDLGIVEAIVPEPLGGAHRSPEGAAQLLGQWIGDQLDEIGTTPIDDLIARRYDRFRALGRVSERVAEATATPADEPG
jgi:acetyl-CoA carboxylase carboxyl transferase subunit alpha